MLRVVLIALSVLALLIAAVGPSASQGTPPTPGNAPIIRHIPPGPRPSAVQAMRLLSPQMLPAISARLRLTGDQITKATELLNKAEDALKPKVEAQRKAVADFATTLTKADATQADLVAAANKAAQAEMAIIEERIKTLFDLRSLLDDQQKAEFNRFVEERTSVWRSDATSPGVGMIAPPPPPVTPPAGTK